MRKIVLIITNLIHSLRLWNRFRISESELRQRAKTSNNLIDKTVKGEREYLKKWRPISKYVSVVDYRLYSHYIGNNPNIIPEFIMREIIEPVFHPKGFLAFYNDKNMYDKLLPQKYLAKTYFRSINGIFTGGGYNIVNQDDFEGVFGGCEKIIIKPTIETGNGSGILLYQREGASFFPIGHEVPFCLDAIKQQYPHGNFVIQECVEQSDFTAQFNTTSVNTFRVFTYKSVTDNVVHVLGIVFRIGAGGALVDNCHAGGRFIGVNYDGSFANECVFDQNGNKYIEFNGIDFSKTKFVVPDFAKVLDFSKMIGECIFHHRTLDLDVMIDKLGNPKLIEFNVDMCSPWFYHFAVGPVFQDFTDEVIAYIKNQIK